MATAVNTRTKDDRIPSSESDDSKLGIHDQLLKLRTLMSQSMESESSTITQCLHEEREENQRLRAKLKKLEAQLISQNKQNPSASVDIAKLKSAGFSKQVVDNLIRENLKLRNNIKTFARNPEKLEKLSQEKEELELKLQDANQRIQQLLQELDHLRNQLQASPNDKEAKIVALTQKVEILEKERELSEEKCQSLTEESAILRRQLTELAGMCQEFGKKLSQKEQQLSWRQHIVGGNAKEKNQMTLDYSPVKQLENELQENSHKYKELQAQCDRLSQQNQELMATNMKLHLESNQHDNTISQMRLELERLESSQSARDGNNSADFAEVFATVDRLNFENKQLATENQRLQEEMSHLRMEYETQLRQRGRQVDEEHVRILEQQVQICTEDFQHERADREKAQARVAQLETELDLVKRQLEQFQVSHMARLRNQREDALAYYRNQHQNMYGGARAPPGMRARGMIVADGEDEEEDNNLEVDTIDSLPLSHSNGVSNVQEDSSRDDSLQCPRCKQEYAAEEHNRFLEHIDECCS